MQYLNFPPNTKLVGMGTALLQNLIYFACIEKDSYRSSIVVNWLLSSAPFFHLYYLLWQIVCHL